MNRMFDEMLTMLIVGLSNLSKSLQERTLVFTISTQVVGGSGGGMGRPCSQFSALRNVQIVGWRPVLRGSHPENP